MTEEIRSVLDILEELALKIMMVEPGDLSLVGELVSLLEELGKAGDIDDFSAIFKMAGDLEKVFGHIIMAELDDSPENYALIGKCISQMQEVHRKGGESEEAVRNFNNALKKIGYDVPDEAPQPHAAQEDKAVPAGPPEIKEIDPGSEPIPDFLQDVELLSGFIDETLEHLESIEVNVLDLEESPNDAEIINNIFRPFHTIKGVSGFLNLKKIQELAHCTENLLDDVRNGTRSMDSSVIDVVLKVGDLLKVMVENIKLVLDEGAAKYKNYDIGEYVAWVKSVQAGEAVSQGQSETGDIVKPAEVEVQTAGGTDPIKNPAEKPSPPVKAASSTENLQQKSAQAQHMSKPGASIKVDVEKLDGLVDAVGELVIMQAMVRGNPLVGKISDPKLAKDFSQLARITSELQKTAMSMRMVPIRQTFQKMIRLVRDLSQKTGKKVDLVMTGEETEIDRNMVDSIYDPLVHMMRNSVDHGVQMPEEREKMGKSATGTVHLRAYQKGGNMVIEIEDDGQGLNTVKIRSKAVERNLINENDKLSNHELNNLIFLPGFSTADHITDVSGRGVGMDVVKKGVEKLRGRVEVFSEPGNGSQFIIRLPLTLAIIDGIIVQVGAERYIIPTTAIQESLKPTEEQYQTVHGKGEALMIRNTLVPVIRLADLFGVESSQRNIFEGIVVVVEAEGKRRAILVDELLGKQEVVIKNLGGLREIKGVAGGTILGDGRVGLILDLAGLVSSTIEVSSREEV
jgi:two-component system chemotaxis sensor kinase CheA